MVIIMNSLQSASLIEFFTNFDIFLLISIRLIGFFIVAPIVSTPYIPMRAKISFSIFFAYIIFISGKITDVFYYDSIPGYFAIGIQELIVGIIIGLTSYIVFSIIFFAGQLMDYQIGFSMVNVLDPVSQVQVPVTGNLFYFFICLILIESGGLHSFISAIFYSYDVLPIGAAKILANPVSTRLFMNLLSEYLVLGVLIAFPIVGTILIIDVVLGIVVKAVPQMNVFAVGMPIKLLLGLTIIYLIVPYYMAVYNTLFDKAFNTIMFMIRGLMP